MHPYAEPSLLCLLDMWSLLSIRLIALIQSVFLLLFSYSWYHGKITKQEAYNLLMTGTLSLSTADFTVSFCPKYVVNII